MTRSENMEHVEVLRSLRGSPNNCQADIAALDAAIAALSAPQSGDWVLVPREPTPEMLSAAGRLQACECGFVGDMSPMDGEEYAAMLAAAPQPPAEAQERPAKPAECADGCPDQQVCDHCQWPPGQITSASSGATGCAHQFRAIPVQVQRDMLAAGFEPPFLAPPSAPVGVEVVRRVAENIRANLDSLPSIARVWADDLDQALSQQPAAPHTCSNCEGISPESCLFNQQPAAVDGLANLAAAVRQHLRWREAGVSRVPSIAELREWAEAFEALAAQQGGAK